MNIESNENRDDLNKTKIAVINLIALMLVAAGIVLDYFWLKDLEYELLYVSIDSVLALIGLASSFLLPYAENRVYKKYNLSDEDIREINGNSKVIYINLLVIALIILLADAIFYTIRYAATLIIIIAICILYLCVFVAPGLFQYIEGEAAIIDKASEKYNDYVNNPNIEFEASRKLIIFILLDKGFDSTIELFKKAKCNKDNKLDESYEKELFVFLSTEQTKYLNDISNDPHISDILTQTLTREILANLSYLTSEKSSERINSLGEEKYEIFKGVCNNLIELSWLISDANFKEEFRNDVTSMVINIMNLAFYSGREISDTYLDFLNFIFVVCLNFNNIWFIEVFGELCNKFRDFRIVNQQSYLIILYFEVIGFFCNTNRHDDENLKDYVIKILKDRTKPLGEEIERINDEVSTKSICRMFNVCKESINRVWRHCLGEYHQFFSDFNDTYLRYTNEQLQYILPITYYNGVEKVDNLFELLNEDEIKFFTTYDEMTAFGGYRYFWDLDDFVNLINELSVLSKKLEVAKLFDCISYIYNYFQRRESMKLLKTQLGFDSYINDFKNYERTCPRFSEDTSSIIEKKNSRRKIGPFRLSFYINQNVAIKELESQDSPLYISSLLNNIIEDSVIDAIDHWLLIDDYDQARFEQIKTFAPTYKNAPKFDEYCSKNNISLSECTNCAWFNCIKMTDTFIQENIVYHNIKFSKIYIRPITYDEAKECIIALNSIDDRPHFFDDKEISFLKLRNLKKGEKELVDEFKSNYYFVSIIIDTSKCVFCDENKMLLFEIK